LIWSRSLSADLNLTEEPRINSDKLGGAYITWANILTTRNPSKGFNYSYGSDIYTQKIDSKGNINWQVDGLPVYTSEHNGNNPRIVADNAGGAFIVYSNLVQLNIQKVDAGGKLIWLQSLECKVKSFPYYSAKSDGFGGIILDWIQSGEERVQNLDSTGKKLWGDNGVAIVANSDLRSSSSILRFGNMSLISRDEKGGVFITWSSGSNSLMQRVDSMGNRSYGDDGILLNRK
jgi:hypothetical protein